MPLPEQHQLTPRILPESLKSWVVQGVLNSKDCFFLSELTGHVLKGLRGAVPNRDCHRFKPLTRDFLVSLLTSGYSSTISKLKVEGGLGLVEVYLNGDGRESYSTIHHSSKQYRLVKRLRQEVMNDQLFHYRIEDKRMNKRFEKWLDGRRTAQFERHPWLQEEVAHFADLQFQTSAAERFVDESIRRREFRGEPMTSGQLHYLERSVHELDKSLNVYGIPSYVSVKHGRVFHGLTNCPKELRRYVRTKKGEKLVEVDLNAAQFVFLAKALGLAHSKGIQKEIIRNLNSCFHEPIDLMKIANAGGLVERQLGAFFRAVFELDIYTELGLLASSPGYVHRAGERLPTERRKVVKQSSIANLLFSYDSRTKVNDGDLVNDLGVNGAMSRNYPLVMRFLQDCKLSSEQKKKSSGLAVLLQSMEGFFFHQVLGPLIQEQIPGVPFFIVHDAVYVPASKASDVVLLSGSAMANHLGWTGTWTMK